MDHGRTRLWNFVTCAASLRLLRNSISPALPSGCIEQSPLSRAIKELEEELGVMLFARTTRSTRLTRAGELFLEHVRRVLSAWSRHAIA